jgi:hypothetical protein
MRAPLRPTANRLALAVILTASAHQLGCMSQPNAPVGVVRVAITMVPADVSCISLTAVGSRTATQLFDVTPGSSSVLMMPGLPTGAVTFTALAFAGPCSMAGDISTANWVSDPVTLQVAAGMVVDVSLVMHRNGRARVGVDFQDDTMAQGTCNDGIQNSTETDVDCGGANMAHICAACADGKHCLVAHDCVSGVCTGGVCATPTCSDGARNGGETGVDCGGPTMCPRCADGQGCTTSSDCASGTCDGGQMRCVASAAACNDGIQNSTETDVDCGGITMAHSCSPCADGQHCLVGRDCFSGVCAGGSCSTPTCSDGARNGGETGVDCGGPTMCRRCDTGEGCTSPTDCANGNCDPTMRCSAVAATCADGILNGNESDVDCGGPCPACADGRHCRLDADCAGGTCSAGICATATSIACANGVQDGNETGVDCGGGSCPGCPFGGRCFVNTDCFSNVCDQHLRRCRGSCTDGIQDGSEPDVDCGFSCNVGCADGQHCVTNNDCASNSCVGGICQTTTCADGARDGTETDVDCGGNVCRACQAGQSCHDRTDCFNGQCDNQQTCTSNNTGCTIDGIFDNGETDLDCGGPCPPCAVGLRCLVNTDCTKPQACVGGFCAATVSCTDGVQDGDETGVDCGGTSCLACPGARCRLDTDCQSNLCLHDSHDIVAVCSSLTCGNGVQDGTETDVDCGGGVTCHLCAVGQHCQVAKDCVAGLCVAGVCNTCTDGVQDGDETGVDCGGASCLECPGTRCRVDTDCASNVCLRSKDLFASICASPTCGDGVQDGPETDVDCGGVGCNQCLVGQGCQVDSDCLKGTCLNGTCFPLSCGNGVRDGTETDIDCGGGTCPPCAANNMCQTPSDCTSGLCLFSTCL